MLIGVEILLELFTNESIRLLNGLLVLQNTELGWIVAGKIISFKQVSLHCRSSSFYSYVRKSNKTVLRN